MASTTGIHNIPFFPPEIYFSIVRFVHRDDLPNFRLASRLLDEIGKPELFKTFVLKSTLASVSRLKHITQVKQLSQLVRTLIWDINCWRVGPNVRDWHEWTRHCEARAKVVDPDQTAMYTELAASRQHWEAYLSRLAEEKAAIREFRALFTFDMEQGPMAKSSPSACVFKRLRLPNLHKVRIVRGISPHLHNSRVRQLQGKLWLPLTRPLSEWRGDSFSRSIHQISLFAILALAFSATKLRFDGFTVEDHNKLNYFDLQSSNSGYGRNLTSLQINCNASGLRRHSPVRPYTMHGYLKRWPELQSLSYDLHMRCRDDITGSLRSLRTVQDTFETYRETATLSESEVLVTWPKLRKLSLGHFDSSPRALLSLVVRHSPTLRDLRLYDIWLDGTGEDKSAGQHTWREMFSAISTATSLEKVALAGVFCNNQHEDDVWDFGNQNFARAVADDIINIGDFSSMKGQND